MRANPLGNTRLSTMVGVSALLALGAACGSGAQPRAAAARRKAAVVANTPGTPINLTAQRMTTTLRDGTTSPMWGYCPTGACTGAWAPGPTIVATAGTSLQISLTNGLPVPTSLVILGQLGGGLGAPTRMASPPHPGQNYTTFPGNAPVNAPGTPPAFVPPAQAQRVRSFGTEVPAAGSATLTWDDLRPGTYLYETGTLPSLQVPMGLYGVLVVTTAPVAGTTFTPGIAYPGVSYDDEATLLFSEMDPVQNAAVDAAAVAGTDVNLRFNDPACTTAAPCYPAAVNYTPTYFFINGKAFDRTAPQNSEVLVGDTAPWASGNVLVRLLNAGSRTHVPSIVGLPMALVAEDGNPAPGLPKVESEVLLTAGKTFDALVRPPQASGSATYAPNTYPVFDRQLSLSTDNHPDGGMQGFLLVNHAAAVAAASGVAVAGTAGNLPAAIAPKANDDSLNVPFNTAASGNVTANDVGVVSVALGSPPSSGSVSLNPDGSFTYTPTSGTSGADSFTYVGNGDPLLTAKVTLTVAARLTGSANMPVAVDDGYTSAFATKFSAPRPGVLANDTDPNDFPLTAGSATAGSCASVSLAADGSFSVTGAAPSCAFTYVATNSQGNASAPATVTVAFGPAGSVPGPAVSVVDAASGVALSDYRWTLQEDLTFDHAVGGTPPVSTRTVGTSFHRSHMPVVATGCVGPVSCGSGQTVGGVAQAPVPETTPDQAMLDPARRYYLSILPGDGSPPGHAMGGGRVVAVTSSTGAFSSWAPLTVKLEGTPLVTAQMSIYLYEDNNPTNGQNDLGENPLGGFNVILFDPAGRTGDVGRPADLRRLQHAALQRPARPPGLPGRPERRAPTAPARVPRGNLVGAVYTCPNDPNAGTPAANPGQVRAGRPRAHQEPDPRPLRRHRPPRRGARGAGRGLVADRDAGGHAGAGRFHRRQRAALLPGVRSARPARHHRLRQPGPPGEQPPPRQRRRHHHRQGHQPAHVAPVRRDPVGRGHLRPLLLHDLPGGAELPRRERPRDRRGAVRPGRHLPAQERPRRRLRPGRLRPVARPDHPERGRDRAARHAGGGHGQHPGAELVHPARPEHLHGPQQERRLRRRRAGHLQRPAHRPLPQRRPLQHHPLRQRRQRHPGGALPALQLVRGRGRHHPLQADRRPHRGGRRRQARRQRRRRGRLDLHLRHRASPPSAPRSPARSPTASRASSASATASTGAARPTSPARTAASSGTVVYSSTRPFDDMRFNVQTIWEPLVPRVTVNLYRKDTLADGTQTLTLVDTTQTSSWDDFVNLVYGADGEQYHARLRRRPPRSGHRRRGAAGAYPPGKQVNLQCPGQLPGTTAPPPWDMAAVDPFTNYTLGGDRYRCYDGWHDWNQVQAAPYDGRYTFPSAAYVAAHPLTAAQTAAGQTLVSLPPGTYVVEAVTPPGYEVVKEEDKNILIGDAFVGPAPQQFGPLGSIFILPDQATLGNANPGNPGTGDPASRATPPPTSACTASPTPPASPSASATCTACPTT